METLMFEVVNFQSAYHAILGRPAYAKFMARPCYVYLKMKMPGPHGVITISGDFKRSNECEAACVDIAESFAVIEELERLKESVDAKLALPSSSNKKPATEGSFQSDKSTKTI